MFTLRRFISAVLLFAMLNHATVAFAQFSPPPNMAAVSVREYYVAGDLGKPLVTVHLLNGVSSPGVYHVPADTDIAQLLAFAGGATERSDLTEITVRRAERGGYHITELDLEKALKDPKDLFRIQDQDVVQITQKFSTDKTLQWVSIASALASILLSVYLIKNSEK